VRDDVPRLGLKAQIAGRSLQEIARECLGLARAGLARRARRDQFGRDETHFLDPLDVIVETGVTPAETLLEKYNGPWRRSVEPAYSEYAF
jgi:glutamate--cysteine ligase